MLDCKNIDALMIDWLYEELDESTAATFNEHVAQCAHCEQELASLQRTRAAVKDLPQLEPPLTVSNILLHEAAKRGPVPAKSNREERGVFASIAAWFVPVLRHPALTAAACLVLVAGVAGSLYLRGKGGFAEPTADTKAPPPKSSRAVTSEPTPQPTDQIAQPDDKPADKQPEGKVAESSPDPNKNGEAKELDGEASGKSAVEQGFGDRVGRLPTPKEEKASELAKIRNDLKLANKKKQKSEWTAHKPTTPASRAVDKPRGEQARKFREAKADDAKKQAERWNANRRLAKEAQKRRRPQPTSPVTARGVTTNAVTGADRLVQRRRSGNLADNEDDSARGAGARDGSRSHDNRPMTKSPAPPPAGPRPVIGGVTSTKRAQLAPRQPARSTATERVQPAAAKPVPANVPKSTSQAQARYRAYKVSPRVQIWTESQHQRLNAAVKNRKCLDAAKIANDILDRNPSYYYQRVGSSQQVKVCRWYVNQEWNRRAKTRASRSKYRSPKESGAAGKPNKAKAAPRPDLAE